MSNAIIDLRCGDCLEIMKEIPNKSIAKNRIRESE